MLKTRLNGFLLFLLLMCGLATSALAQPIDSADETSSISSRVESSTKMIEKKKHKHYHQGLEERSVLVRELTLTGAITVQKFEGPNGNESSFSNQTD